MMHFLAEKYKNFAHSLEGGGAYLGAVVAGILLLVTVSGNMSGPVTLVTTIFFLAALAGKMTEPRHGRSSKRT